MNAGGENPGKRFNRAPFLGAGDRQWPSTPFRRSRLDQMIDLRHPLAVLVACMPWNEIDNALSTAFAHTDRAAREVEAADLVGTTLQLAGACAAGSAATAPRRVPSAAAPPTGGVADRLQGCETRTADVGSGSIPG